MRLKVISDHALLRWMQRKHGIDIEAWRNLMRDDVAASMEAYDGRAARCGPAFLIDTDGNAVVTYVTSGWPISPIPGRIAVTAVESQSEEAAA